MFQCRDKYFIVYMIIGGSHLGLYNDYKREILSQLRDGKVYQPLSCEHTTIPL